MRNALTFALLAGIGVFAASSPTWAAPSRPAPLPADATLLRPVEYYCSPGFEPGRGGTCVAVPSRAEVELFEEQPYGGSYHRFHRHHRRHGLRERY